MIHTNHFLNKDFDKGSNFIDEHIQLRKIPLTPNAKTHNAIGTNSDPIAAINTWIKTSYDRRDGTNHQVIYIIKQ